MREAGDPLKFLVAGLTLRQKQQRGDQRPSVPVVDVFTLKSFYCLWNNTASVNYLLLAVDLFLSVGIVPVKLV